MKKVEEVKNERNEEENTVKELIEENYNGNNSNEHNSNEYNSNENNPKENSFQENNPNETPNENFQNGNLHFFTYVFNYFYIAFFSAGKTFEDEKTQVTETLNLSEVYEENGNQQKWHENSVHIES